MDLCPAFSLEEIHLGSPLFNIHHGLIFFINFLQAIVVCKQLGFEGALKSGNNSPYGSVPRPFSYKGLSCTGSEVRLEDCPRFGSGECSARTGAGVVCYSHTTPEGKYDFKD